MTEKKRRFLFGSASVTLIFLPHRVCYFPRRFEREKVFKQFQSLRSEQRLGVELYADDVRIHAAFYCHDSSVFTPRCFQQYSPGLGSLTYAEGMIPAYGEWILIDVLEYSESVVNNVRSFAVHNGWTTNDFRSEV